MSFAISYTGKTQGKPKIASFKRVFTKNISFSLDDYYLMKVFSSLIHKINWIIYFPRKKIYINSTPAKSVHKVVL